VFASSDHHCRRAREGRRYQQPTLDEDQRRHRRTGPPAGPAGHQHGRGLRRHRGSRAGGSGSLGFPASAAHAVNHRSGKNQRCFKTPKAPIAIRFSCRSGFPARRICSVRLESLTCFMPPASQFHSPVYSAAFGLKLGPGFGTLPNCERSIWEGSSDRPGPNLG
jgi:hypothetical protein